MTLLTVRATISHVYGEIDHDVEKRRIAHYTVAMDHIYVVMMSSPFLINHKIFCF